MSVVIIPSPAPEPGALDGWAIVCSICAAKGHRSVGSSSLETLARQQAHGHAQWHAGRG